MTDLDALRGSSFAELVEEFAAANKSLGDLYDAQRRHNNAQADETAKLWQEVAELRDEILAVANRLEALTHFVTSDPAETAAAIIDRFQCRTSAGCNLSRPHIHHTDGGVVYVEDEAAADDQLAQRREVDRMMRGNRVKIDRIMRDRSHDDE